MSIDLLTYRIRVGTTAPTRIDDAGSGVVYQSFNIVDSLGKEPLVKIVTADGVTTFYKAFDTWVNRATTTYSLLTRGR